MSTSTREPLPTTLPTRFREAQARGERLGQPLRRLGKVAGLDEALLSRIGRALGERDELGHGLADAMRTREAVVAHGRRRRPSLSATADLAARRANTGPLFGAVQRGRRGRGRRPFLHLGSAGFAAAMYGWVHTAPSTPGRT